MNRVLLPSALVGLLLAIPQPAGADPLELINYSTRTFAFALVVGGGQVVQQGSHASTASLAVGPNRADAQTTLTAVLAPDDTAFSGAGVITTSATARYPVGANGQGQAVASLEFSIDQPYTYSFLGSFEPSATNWNGLQTYLERLPGLNEYESIFMHDFPPLIGHREGSILTRTDVGRLLPGRYYFASFGNLSASCGFVMAEGQCFSEAFTRFTFDLRLAPEADTPVPEPATMILLGSGLVGVFAARRRHGRA